VRGATRRRLPRGLDGEALRRVACDAGLVIAGDVAAVPAVSVETVRAHDRVVSQLVALFPAVLPVRFGAVLADEEALAAALAGRGEEMAAALTLVSGCEQMTLRLYGEPAAVAAHPVPAPGPGPGARYLGERMSARRAETAIPELGPLRSLLAPLVRAERAERHHTPPLLATVHHLVERGGAAAYLAAVAGAGPSLGNVRARASGPWAPYAFAPRGAA
jgi:gas vesicle protein GvpL/GvpF